MMYSCAVPSGHVRPNLRRLSGDDCILKCVEITKESLFSVLTDVGRPFVAADVPKNSHNPGLVVRVFAAVGGIDLLRNLPKITPAIVVSLPVDVVNWHFRPIPGLDCPNHLVRTAMISKQLPLSVTRSVTGGKCLAARPLSVPFTTGPLCSLRAMSKQCDRPFAPEELAGFWSVIKAFSHELWVRFHSSIVAHFNLTTKLARAML